MRFDPIEDWPETISHPMVFDDSLSFLEKVGRLRAIVNQIIAAYNAFDAKQIEFDGRLDAFMAFVDNQIATYADEHMLESIQAAITAGNFDALITALWVPYAQTQTNNNNTAMSNHTIAINALIDAANDANAELVAETLAANYVQIQEAMASIAQAEVTNGTQIDAALLALANATAPTNIVPLLNSALKGVEGRSYGIAFGHVRKDASGWTVANDADEASTNITSVVSENNKLTVNFAAGNVKIAALFAEPNGASTKYAFSPAAGLTNALVTVVRKAAKIGLRLAPVTPGGTPVTITNAFGVNAAAPTIAYGGGASSLQVSHATAITGDSTISTSKLAGTIETQQTIPVVHSIAGDHFHLEFTNCVTGVSRVLDAAEAEYCGADVVREWPELTLDTAGINAVPNGTGFYILGIFEI